jgi:hypothetical protein
MATAGQRYVMLCCWYIYKTAAATVSSNYWLAGSDMLLNINTKWTFAWPFFFGAAQNKTMRCCSYSVQYASRLNFLIFFFFLLQLIIHGCIQYLMLLTGILRSTLRALKVRFFCPPSLSYVRLQYVNSI